MNKKKFAQSVRLLVKSGKTGRECSRLEVSRKLGINPSTLWRWEHAKSTPVGDAQKFYWLDRLKAVVDGE